MNLPIKNELKAVYCLKGPEFTSNSLKENQLLKWMNWYWFSWQISIWNQITIFLTLLLFKSRVTQPLHTICAYCTDENRSYLNKRGKSEKTFGLYVEFSQVYHKSTALIFFFRMLFKIILDNVFKMASKTPKIHLNESKYIMKFYYIIMLSNSVYSAIYNFNKLIICICA